ncbi:MAG TPA: carbohydrate ABC transporter permease [Candidatus Onthenecus intestinigallinarum]|uniref:Carbohydrate ABC transporter permease n=1 Tax=Candidatus Onthenecus intestinigallinarum TaxID=2840875 RepID=A0A9D0ZC86_9FIRM|nr:carbohydrate ABC transporter permease [Candidatus Onthenecus intestinigallinarum]
MTTERPRAATRRDRIEAIDIVLLVIITVWAFLIIVPVYNVVVISFTPQKTYLETPVLLYPKMITLQNYADLFEDGRIFAGYRSTLLILLCGLPLNLILTTSFAYGSSRSHYPGRRLIFLLVLFTMIFNGGIIPLYLIMRQLDLTNTIWSVVFAYGINTFYMIIMRNYFCSLPESLMESAKLDGAGEWRTLFSIVLPLSLPIMATITLFYAVDRWNEWYNAMIFIQRSGLQPLQLVLRAIVIESQVLDSYASADALLEARKFSMGLKAAAVVVTMVPVMCVFPFLQKHFVKGVMVGAIKA